MIANSISEAQTGVIYYINVLLSTRQVEQYMQCFPTECVPLFGSKGEEWREGEFMKQLPAYDTCPEACHDMADIDKKRMIKFVDMRRKKCFGVGEIEVLSECKVK